MRPLALALLALATPAAAQTPYPQLQPGQFLPAVPPPPGASSPPATDPPVIVTAPLPPPVVTPVPVAPVGPEWLPAGGAELRVLDKLTARVTTLALKQGDTARIGPLSISLRACLLRPPDRAPDAAAFLDITDATGGAGFHGWMIVSSPALALLEHPGYDVRPLACKP